MFLLETKEIQEKYLEAINHLDDNIAKQTIQKIDDFLLHNQIEKNDLELYKSLQAKKNLLKIIAFSRITDGECINIIKNHFLDPFKAEIDMESRLTQKLFYIPFAPRDELRKKFKEAILENNQILGSLPIKNWILAFEKELDINSRTLNAYKIFVEKNKLANQLKAPDKEILEKVLRSYDYFLAQTLPTTSVLLPQNNNLQNKASLTTPMKKDHPAKENIVKTDIQKIFNNYPKIKQQTLGSAKISIKNSPQPVLPTIENWIRDYVFSMGQEKHTAIERGRYLFQNKNTLHLNAKEKENLSLLLKSFDENSPLVLDKNSQIIIFDKTLVENKPVREKNKEEFTFHQRMSFENKNANAPEKKNLPIQKTKSGVIDIPSQKKIVTNSTTEEKRNQKNLIDLKDFN